MDESKVIWCKKSVRKPVEFPIEPGSQRGRYLHEYWDEKGHISRCYLDHEGECDWVFPQKDD